MLYAVAARHTGLCPAEILLMSVLIYSSAIQMALLPLLAGGAGLLSMVFTAIALNIQFLLYGLTLRARMRLSWLERVFAAYGLTDVAYGFTIAESDRADFSFLLGAEASIFTVWTLSRRTRHLGVSLALGLGLLGLIEAFGTGPA
jgi:predicted branched-subunit amino acid permease